MGGRIEVGLAPVAGRGDHLAAPHDHRADRHVTGRRGLAGLGRSPSSMCDSSVSTDPAYETSNYAAFAVFFDVSAQPGRPAMTPTPSRHLTPLSLAAAAALMLALLGDRRAGRRRAAASSRFARRSYRARSTSRARCWSSTRRSDPAGDRSAGRKRRRKARRGARRPAGDRIGQRRTTSPGSRAGSPTTPGRNPSKTGPRGGWQKRQWNMLPCHSLCYPGPHRSTRSRAAVPT